MGDGEKLYKTMQIKMADESKSKQTQGCSLYPSNPTIYQVPKALRKMKKTAYTPRVISIGPLHNDYKHLKHMEQHKVSYLRSLLCRTIDCTNARNEDDHVNQEMRICGDAMLEVVECARACYAESPEQPMDKLKLAEIMLLDGCFILEFLYRDYYPKEKDNNNPFSNSLTFLYITHDLFLLENQIPFFVFQTLFELTIKQIPTKTSVEQIQTANPEVSVHLSKAISLNDLILKFYDFMVSSENMGEDNKEVDHILGLLHKCYLPYNGEPSDDDIIQYSATELDRAGIKFKAGGNNSEVTFKATCSFSWLISATKYILACNTTTSVTSSINCCWLSFFCHWWNWPTFEIPTLRIDDITEPFLRNLIALEQCSPIIPRKVTSYAYLMDTLIDSNKDVELLQKAKVVENNLGASEFASDLINNICNEVLMGKFSYHNQWTEVNNYCKQFWPRHLASLRRTYFYSPWAIISVIAGLLLFALTVVQTFNKPR